MTSTFWAIELPAPMKCWLNELASLTRILKVIYILTAKIALTGNCTSMVSGAVQLVKTVVVSWFMMSVAGVVTPTNGQAGQDWAPVIPRASAVPPLAGKDLRQFAIFALALASGKE